ncbi:MAG TPA: class I SAM-dependent methyltransferase [Xanthomonadales bacterium]|nr:class I SAM-dependent methyltransferase [Xanthomonadales bacterium]
MAGIELHNPQFRAWIKERVEAEPYWFHRMTVYDGLVTNGWSDPTVAKLPFYGLPERMDHMRVLDVGCAEGFFSFEAERRGAGEVVAIDSYPGSMQRFGIMRDALNSKVKGYLCNVYDLSPKTFGTFDLVMFFGVLYHLKHPWYALEKLLSVCSNTMLLQTLVADDPRTLNDSLAWFYPFGMESGLEDARQFDPTVFWVPTPECTKNLVRAAGFSGVEDVTNEPEKPYVMRATIKDPKPSHTPDPMSAPWS